MGRALGFIYGIAAYVLFLGVFLYLIGFVANGLVPKSIDSGTPGDTAMALMVNAALLALFAVQHSAMARPAFKARWARIVPPAVERSTYVLLTNFALMLLMWKWQPMPGLVWNVEHPVAVALLWGLCALGWAIVLASSFAINHFDLFGLRQVYLNLRNADYTNLDFRITWLYGLVRHPLLLGFLIAFWATPRMSAGHLFFALANTLYILAAIQLEERDMLASFGDTYRKYKAQVPMILPLPRKR